MVSTYEPYNHISLQLYPLIRNATKRKNDTSFQKKQYDAKFVCLMENNRSKCTSSGHTELNRSNMSVSGFNFQKPY